MEEEEDFEKEASTQYTDWKGTVALDDPHEELDHEVLGIDFDRWLI